MRILLVSSEYPPETGAGGIGTYAATLAPALAELGHQVTVVSRSPDETASDDERDGVRVVRVVDVEPPPDFFGAPFSPAEAARAPEHYRRAFSVALALMTRDDLGPFDIAEVPDWAGEGALFAVARPELPYVVKFHTPARLVFGWNDCSIDPAFVEALHTLERVGVANAAAWSCPSAWMGAACESLFGLPRASVRRLPNPLDAAPFLGSPGPRKPHDILYVGRLESRKGVLELAPAVTRVLAELPDARFQLLGADTRSGPDGRSVRECLLGKLPTSLHGRVRFRTHASRSEVAEALACAGVVVLPSRRENFPYTCLEAMATGAAVVASPHGGMAEMIEPNRSGLLVDPADSDALHDALLRVLLQPRVAQRLGAAARAHVLAAYSPRAMAAQHVAFYEDVLASRASTMASDAQAVLPA